ncbi:iron-containing alcohol dehydrogenase [Paenibacillus yanchengensis]|uniref:Iron-containing alcohol dehydrogenase n=1 Tax=Paenibacillus yanchengensis TaxID=2035833 RepID=A0ABW4YPD6_9BACL
MMNNFQFQTAGQIVAELHSVHKLADYMEKFARVRRVLILSQPAMQRAGYLDNITTSLQAKDISCDVITSIAPEPTDAQLTAVFEDIRKEKYDVIIAIGGGSVLDAAKIIAVMFTNELSIRQMLGTNLVTKPGLPLILIPTTSGTGSEVTPNAIVTLPDEQLKVAVVSPYLYPDLVILDAQLTVGLPAAITAATGMDAFTHALESFISNKANVMSNTYAKESMRLISNSIAEVYHNGSNIKAREQMLIGSMYGGMALSCSGTAAVHALAYPLGGMFHITHGVANAMLLPHVTEFNRDAIEPQLMEVAKIIGLSSNVANTNQAATAVIDQIVQWTKELHVPQNLADYGVQQQHIDQLASAAAKVTRLLNNNPKEVTLEDMKHIYRKILK